MDSEQRKVIVAIPTSGSDGRQRLAGIYRYLGENQYWEIQLYRSQNELSDSLIHKSIKDGVNGFIFAMPYSGQTLRTLMETGLPVVVMTDAERIDATTPLLRRFFVDNAAIGKAAAHFFQSLGRFETFAYIPDTYCSIWSQERESAFFANLPKRIQRSTFKHSIDVPACRQWPQDHLKEFLLGLPKPAAVFAANDNYAIQIINAARSAGLAVPVQVSVLGVDNDELLTQGIPITLSSIEPDFNEAGYRAAEALEQMMAAGKKIGARESTSKFHLYGIKNIIARQSTGFLSPSSQLVSDAERLIKSESVTLDSSRDVARRLRVSRSLLDLRFREILGHSVGESIRKTRLKHVKTLLETTRKPITQIGIECGFQNANYLKYLFKTRYGVTMREWRKANKRPLVKNHATTMAPPPTTQGTSD